MSSPAINQDELIQQAVIGEISPPRVPKDRQWRVGPDGIPKALPGVGGITYNLKVGQSAINWAADHVEPGVSVRTDRDDANTALNMLACVGNEATVVSGDAKGTTGIVTGKHGGVDHILVDFANETLEKLVIGDKIQIRACGLGAEFRDLHDIRVMNVDPRLIVAMNLTVEEGKLKVPVSHKIPAALMGSGIGRDNVFCGDYDIQVFDEQTVNDQNLNELRIGDFVAVMDQDHTFGRVYHSGAVSVGVIVHSCCVQAGHGPGLTTLLTSRKGLLDPVLDENANIAAYLDIGTERVKS